MSQVSKKAVSIKRQAFEKMLRFLKLSNRLCKSKKYHDLLSEFLPVTAISDPNPSVLMGFDFHLTDDGPKLIEINSNAGGLYHTGEACWIPQPNLDQLKGNLEQRIFNMFPKHP